jgi:hypothetical protein
MKSIRGTLPSIPDLVLITTLALLTGLVAAFGLSHSAGITEQISNLWTRTGWTAAILFPMMLTLVASGMYQVLQQVTGRAIHEWSLKINRFCMLFGIEIGFLGTLWGLAVSLEGVTFSDLSAFFRVIEGFSESIFSSIFGVGIYLLAKFLQYLNTQGGSNA